METAKADVQSRPGKGPRWVSTNDVITSGFASIVNPRLFEMRVNWRGKLPYITDVHAGNYEGSLLYCPKDYATPALIRKSISSKRGEYKAGLPQFRRAAFPPTDLPNFWEG